MATKRVRTGCLKCRVRRRKCDEGKPRCQRCIAGGFECQYGTRLSFLPKNSFTLNDPAPPSRPNPSPGYRKVQFVNAGAPPSPDAASASSSSQPGQFSPEPMQVVMDQHNHAATDRPLQSLSGQLQDILPTTASHSMLSPTMSKAQGSMLPPQSPGIGPLQHPGRTGFNTQGPVPHELESNSSGRYQDALDALLSLGADEAENSAPGFQQQHQTQDQLSPVHFKPSPHAIEDAERDHRIQHLILSGELRDTVTVPPSLGNTLSEERVLVLLKHWRYDVAPWLDLFDLGHGFGIYVSLLASHSKIVLEALIALSSVSHDKHFDMTSHPEDHIIPQVEGAGTSAMQNGFDMSSQVKLLCIVLRSARSAYRKDSNGAAALTTVLDRFRLERPMTMVGTLGFQLLLRLELATALIEERALPVSLYDLGVMATPWHKSQLAREVFFSSMQTLIYCIRAVSLAFGEIPESTPGGMVGAWLALIEDLNAWYQGRTQEFQSIIEMNDSEDGLPTVLFTNGAGGFANQMYHTAMLLLLRHKPRTAQLPGHLKSSATSFLWHARRICGIALNNDLQECWDPCLVSSLVIAAKSMSHEDQHETILRGLDRIGLMTKWDVSRYQAILQMEWGS